MNRIILFLATLVALLILTVSSSATPKRVYVLPINDEIGSTTWLHTRSALEEAKRLDADLLLLHLNTYGGTLEHADSMRTALHHCSIPTVAFVDNNAASAGALIALACDSVYMRPDASMGAATVVNGSDGQAMPDKYQSYMRAMMRATAERHGKYVGEDGQLHWRRDPLIAEAMVDSRVVVPGLIDSTRVLTMTPDEAIRWGYAEGKAETIDQVLTQLDIPEYRLIRYEPTWIDNLMGFLTNPVVQSLLIMIMMGGIYFELQTPGVGFPSLAALVAAIIYFLPMYLTGILAPWVVLLFVGGLILLLVEIFIIPGFGVTGILGACMMVAAIFIGLLENFSLPSTPQLDGDLSPISQAIIVLVVAAVLTGLAIWYIYSRWSPSWLRSTAELGHVQKVEDGYIGVDTSLRQLVGKQGVAATALRPSGKVEIEGERYDAVSSHGSYIEPGTPITVSRYENAQLYVNPR
ncbi:MAG: nodulation protein NfeD [Bacteroidales bacterium]|nr:nodulation protein NfeD [Bacteroidales bacterium]